MKSKFRLITILALTYYFILLNFDSFACFGVIAGKKTTQDGSVLVGHAEQNGPPAFLNFVFVPRMKHEANTFVKFRMGGLYPETTESYSYLWSENFGMHGSDGILNEWGVMCVSDATHSIENPDDLIKQGIISNGGVTLEIRLEIARRAKTARQAIHIAADILNRYGYYGLGGTMIIADPNEAWLMTCLAGKHWLAQRVPDDKVVILPNVIIQREVNLKDTINFLASSDIIEYAVKKGWYNPKSGKPFDFKKAYDIKQTGAFAVKNGCDARQWRGQCLVTGKSIDLPLKEDGLPFAVTPNHKMTVLDLRRILSDHMEGTEYDLSNTTEKSAFQLPASNVTVCNPPKDISKPILYNNYNYAKGTPHKLMSAENGMICADNHQEIGVFQLRSWLPAEIGCIYWRTTASPCSSVLTPWYVGITETPDTYHKDYKITDNIKYDFHFNPPAGTYDFDPDKAFWIFNSVENLVDQNYGKYIGLVRSAYDDFEKKEIDQQIDTENAALSLYKKDKNQAKEFLTMYSNGLALKAIEKAKELEKKLKTELLGF